MEALLREAVTYIGTRWKSDIVIRNKIKDAIEEGEKRAYPDVTCLPQPPESPAGGVSR
jgi:hypothetical protein